MTAPQDPRAGRAGPGRREYWEQLLDAGHWPFGSAKHHPANIASRRGDHLAVRRVLELPPLSRNVDQATRLQVANALACSVFDAYLDLVRDAVLKDATALDLFFRLSIRPDLLAQRVDGDGDPLPPTGPSAPDSAP